MKPASPSLTGRQWRLAAAVFAVVVAILGSSYYWFLARDYSVLAANVRPEEASAIVEELKKQDVPYEIRDGGATILVPANQVDLARLDISGGELPMKGTVGFELFNQTDMGLTDFAQKVNYQRALQGEIARTIMSMDGIAYARVHIALPERSLFRGARSEPRAAVALTPKPGVEIDADRIAGIQRLVAATVPDLAIDQVAILNERGDLLTQAFDDVASVAQSESALEANYHDRVARAVGEAAPRAHVEIRVTVLPGKAAVTGDPAATGGVARDHSIRVVIFERSGLTAGEEQAIRSAVASELGLSDSLGDQLLFSPAVEMSRSLAPQLQIQSGLPPRNSADRGENRFMEDVSRAWSFALWLAGALALLAICLAWSRRRQGERRALIDRIRRQLLAADGATDGA